MISVRIYRVFLVSEISSGTFNPCAWQIDVATQVWHMTLFRTYMILVVLENKESAVFTAASNHFFTFVCHRLATILKIV